MKRHQTIVGPSRSRRPLEPSLLRTALPTAAAIAALLAFAPPARAITADDANDDTEIDAAVGDAEDGGDAARCEPYPDQPRLGGVPPPPMIHGSGCGCGRSGNDETVAAFAVSAAVLALARLRRR